MTLSVRISSQDQLPNSTYIQMPSNLLSYTITLKNTISVKLEKNCKDQRDIVRVTILSFLQNDYHAPGQIPSAVQALGSRHAS